jgi:hypothetical protein
VQLRARAAACAWSRGYVNGSGGWICRRLASPVACGVSTAAVVPATSWDKPPLAPGSCEPPGDCCAPLLASGSCEPPGDGPPLAPRSCEAPSCGPPESTCVACLQAASLRARPAAANPATSPSRGPSRRSRTRTLRPGRQEECRCWSCKLEEIVISNHVS